MSSKLTDTTQAQKDSTRHPSTPNEEIDDALAAGRCPHCGGSVDTSLGLHISRDCDPSAWDGEPRKQSDEIDTYPDPPTLDTAPETIDVDEDELDERRALAERLEAEGTAVFGG